MTYLVDLCDVVAFLVITAPEMRCGKSELKRLIGKMVLRPVEADNMSVAVLFRSFDLWQPTLLVDEYDTFIKKDEELRGVFNAGHQRGGCVWRCVGDKHMPTAFDVFGPKVLAGIGKLPSTLMDRGIIVQLRRKLPSETIVRQRDIPAAYFRTIQSKLARMAIDYATSISAARPTLPDTLSDRARDNWEPLFQIAQVAGGDWPVRAHEAALKLSGRDEATKTIGVELLSDIQEAFAQKRVDRLSSAEIINILCDDDEKRWATYNKGFPITPTQVAKRLGEYGICSTTIRVPGQTLKGYHLHMFTDAFARYVFADQLPEVSAVTPELTKAYEPPTVTLASPVTAQTVTRHTEVTRHTSVDGVGDGVTLKSVEGTHEAVVSAVTLDNGTGNADVTCEVPSDEDCDGVTGRTGHGANLPMNPNQKIVFSEFQTLLLQERMNSLIDDKGEINFNRETQSWPEELSLDYVADQVKGKLRYVDQRLRSSISRHLCRQLVGRGDFIQRGDLLSLSQ
jgi:putative DNA primase/helicase